MGSGTADGRFLKGSGFEGSDGPSPTLRADWLGRVDGVWDVTDY